MVKEDYDIFDVEPIIKGEVNIEGGSTKGRVWSVPGSAFWSSTAFTIDGGDGYGLASGSITATAEVNLPNGAVITSVIVYGNDTTRTWTLFNKNLSSAAGTGVTTMATALVGTEDTTISSATIDNTLKGYYLAVGLDNTDNVLGAKIIYTY